MKKIFLLFLMLLVAAVPAGAKSIKQYKKEIKKSKDSLRELQQNIKEKREEKEKHLLEEKSIRSELNRVDKEIKRLQKKKEWLASEIRKAEKNLALATKEMSQATWEKKQWFSVLNIETDSWYRNQKGCVYLFCDPIEENLRYEALKQKKENMLSAKEKESVSKRAIEKWQAAEVKLKELKDQQEATINEQEGVKEEKQSILETTIGKRIAAEEEIKKLRDTEQALQSMLIKLEREKKETEEELAARKKFRTRKKILSWPLRGEIIQSFGKNKHPELDTCVISNGIKIKCDGMSDVSAADSGEVMFTGEFRSYGNMVVVDHGGGFYTIYGLLGEISVKEGDKVKESVVIGRTSDDKPSLLYFEVRVDNKPDDPRLWLK
ncbi:MAG: peptidoglycan DD-metalloendopeptidase family protein [Endomicrobiales bacterium]|nr:peptidoglycan DD-metalloendopeptidase family protein [Endomicrobiales bacterium]